MAPNSIRRGSPQTRPTLPSSKINQLEQENRMLRTAIGAQQYRIQDLEIGNKTNLVVAGIFTVAAVAGAYYIGANPTALATAYTFAKDIPGIVTTFVSSYFSKTNP